MADPAETFPHDYRVIAGSAVAPTIVGGQAVNIWVITYLLPDDPDLPPSQYASGDIDILADPKAIEFISKIPGWHLEKIPLRNLRDIRLARLHSTAPDGRHLLVEVLHKVHGLDDADLRRIAGVEIEGTTYAVLDPIAVLKAKVANIEDLDQAGPPPRHDRQHLQLIAKCVPRYLRDLHAGAIEDESRAPETTRVFSAAFTTLQGAAETLRAEGIDPPSLMPGEFVNSPFEKIRNTYKWQMPRLEEAGVTVSRPKPPRHAF